MKTKCNHWDNNKREFYNNVKEKEQELHDILKAADECEGYTDFNLWYTAKYDWEFLKSILGDRAKCGLPWDYDMLIHLPKIVWKDGTGKEHKTILMGEKSPADYGFGITEIKGGDGCTVTKTADPDGHIEFKIDVDGLADGNVGYDETTAELLYKKDGDYVEMPEIKVGGTKMREALLGKVDIPGTEAVSGEHYHFPYHIGDLRYDTTDSKLKGTLYTITLDNNKTLKQYPLEVQIPQGDVTKAYVDAQDQVLETYCDNLDATKAAQTDLEAEKTRAETEEAKKINKITRSNIVYINDSSINPSYLDFATSATINTIVKRDNAGRFEVTTPTTANQAANKDYVDTAIATSTARFLGTYTGGTVRPVPEWTTDQYTTFLDAQMTAQGLTPTNNDYAFVEWSDIGDYDRCKFNSTINKWVYEYTIVGRQVINQADWNETDTASAAFIKNKPDLSAKLDATKCTYQTTAPTAAITDGGVHIVYLETEPTTKYNGYIYFIK